MTPLEELATRCIWWEKPEEALRDKNRFLTYAMNRCSLQDIALLESHYSTADFSETLAHAAPGIMHPRSWNYWHLRLGHETVPPLPVRKIGNEEIPLPHSIINEPVFGRFIRGRAESNPFLSETETLKKPVEDDIQIFNA